MKKRTNLYAAAAIILATGLMLSACGQDNTAQTADANVDNDDTQVEETVEAQPEETVEEPEVVEVDRVSECGITDPVTEGDVTTWHCIWFGNYWQDLDSNGDGKVTKDDDKEPIKWRVLDIDEEGNAFLFSDKLLDIVFTNEAEKPLEITWENSSLRSFLNCYDASANAFEIDYSEDGFLKNAFNEEESKAISTTVVTNEKNPVFDSGTAGNDTEDKLFLMSAYDMMNPDYGFINDEFTQPSDKDFYFYSDMDSTRVGITTAYADGIEGFPGESHQSPAAWWLRTPGKTLEWTCHVNGGGSVYAVSYHMDEYRLNLRPAFKMNLKEAQDLWEYADTISSDDEAYKTPNKTEEKK